jgi:formate hydrogenlyase subunit 3/multisubunit Na+/H+ antiporter MnhD subunit
MVMPPALWLIVLPIGAVPLVYLLRRLGLGAVLAATVAFLLAWLVTRLPTGVALDLLGRSVELDRLSQITLTILFTATALLFLIPVLLPAITAPKPLWRAPGVKSKPVTADRPTIVQTGIKGREGRAFYPAGLAVLGLFVAASLARHLGIVAILVEGAVILTVFIIQGGRLDSTRAALRFLTLMSLAMPLFLLAAWQLDAYQLSGGVAVSNDSLPTMLLVGFGLALWLAVLPFHSWLTTTAAESAPVSAAFGLISFPVVAFSTMLHLLADFPWLVDSPQRVGAIIIAGVATALVGGVLASVQRGFGELMGYAALFDLGCMLALFGLGGPAGLVIILVGLVVRTLALTLLAASTSAIRLRADSDGFAEVHELAQQFPVATIGLMMGGLTLAGAPFTAGFALHWQLLRAISEVEPAWAILLALAGLGVTVGYLRGFRAMLLPRSAAKAQNNPSRPRMVFTLQEPLGLFVLISLLIATTILLGLFPAIIIEPLRILTLNTSLPIP